MLVWIRADGQEVRFGHSQQSHTMVVVMLAAMKILETENGEKPQLESAGRMIPHECAAGACEKREHDYCHGLT